MKKIIGMLLIAVFTVFPLIGEESEAAAEEEVTNADIVASIEKINEKLEWMFKEAEKMDKIEDHGYDGLMTLFLPTRYLLDSAKLNTFLSQQGSYTAYPELLLPCRNGGGLAIRGFKDNFFMGINYSGYGISSQGFQTHQTAAEQPNDTVDENNDTYHDYYSFANYGMNSLIAIIGAKIDVTDSVKLHGGAQLGYQREEFSIAKTSLTKNWFSNTVGHIMSENPDWTRYTTLVGGMAGIRFLLGNLEVWLEGGFDYSLFPLAWEPAGGIHRTASAPPSDFNTMNAWGNIGFKLAYDKQ